MDVVTQQQIAALEARVSELERRLAELTGGGGTSAVDGVEAEVRSILASGNTIQAIKRYRDLTGAGLAEAKDAVEALQRRTAF